MHNDMKLRLAVFVAAFVFASTTGGVATAQDEAGTSGGGGGSNVITTSSDLGTGQDTITGETSSGEGDGLWLSLGLNYAGNGLGNAGLRFEAGLPIFELPLGVLEIYVPFVWSPNSNYGCVSVPGVSCGSFSNHSINIDPGARWEIPVLEKWGRLAVYGDLGVGIFWSENGGNGRTWASMRFAAGAAFTFPFNLFLSMQPIGVLAIMGHGSGRAAYEYSLSAGYRWD